MTKLTDVKVFIDCPSFILPYTPVKFSVEGDKISYTLEGDHQILLARAFGVKCEYVEESENG